MPKAKLIRGVRITQSPLPAKNRKKGNGRPPGTYKRFKFEETRLGFFLKYEVPVVYDIIMKMTPAAVFPEPPLLLVKTVCKGSKDPSLKKAKFRRYLKEYAAWGLFCKRAKRLTPEREQYYEGIRKRKLGKYLKENRDRIEGMRKIF
jgi:hypothetical protein